MPKFTVLATRRWSLVTWSCGTPKISAAVRLWMSSSRAKASMRTGSSAMCASSRSSTWL